MLICGAAKANINPDLPIPLAGYGPGRIAKHIHDDIHVVALYLEDRPDGRTPATRMALFTYDMPHNHGPFIKELQKRCAAATGLHENCILTTASHSHSSPTIRADRVAAYSGDPLAHDAWRERVYERSVQALEDAMAGACEVTMSFNTARIRENVNRRVFFPDGRCFYLPEFKNLLPIADGPVDDELGVLFFRSVKGNAPVATVVNYTAHPLTVGDTSDDITADYPGVLKREIESSLGGVAMFINGACGDNHPLGAEAGFGRCEAMGLALAEKALYHRWDAVEVKDAPVTCAIRPAILPPMTERDYVIFTTNYGFGFKKTPEEELTDGGIAVHISLWSVGPVLFVGVPGELVSELGLRIKWESPFPRTCIMELATEHLGYIAHRNAYQYGGYEVLSSRFGPDAGAVLCDEALAAAAELKKSIEAAGRRVTLPALG